MICDDCVLFERKFDLTHEMRNNVGTMMLRTARTAGVILDLEDLDLQDFCHQLPLFLPMSDKSVSFAG